MLEIWCGWFWVVFVLQDEACKTNTTYLLLTVIYLLLKVIYLLLTVTYLLLTVTYLLLTVTYLLLTVTYLLLTVRHRECTAAINVTNLKLQFYGLFQRVR